MTPSEASEIITQAGPSLIDIGLSIILPDSVRAFAGTTSAEWTWDQVAGFAGDDMPAKLVAAVRTVFPAPVGA